MSTMSQCSRTVSLLFEDRSFSCTLDLIDLVKQIQWFQKGWTLKPDVLIKQSKMFHFWTLRSIISQKSVTCKTEMQSLSSFWQFWLRSYKSHPLENEKFRKTMTQLSCKNRLPFEIEEQIEEHFLFFMFNYFISDKNVTYKTEILCFSWLSGRSAAWSLLNGREPNIFPFGPTKLSQ